MPGVRIIAAAYRLSTNLIVSLPPPHRHHDILHRWGGQITNRNSGFLTNWGEFVDRKAAFIIARDAGQLLPKKNGPADMLFS